MADLDRLLSDGDLDGLLRHVDDACDSSDWEILEQTAVRSRTAIERGHQLWPAADHAEHRLALQAPGAYAASAVLRDATTFGLAPLAEVAASSHTWEELSPYLPIDSGAVRAVFAHERVARGEDLTGVDLRDDPLSLPLKLAPWEPASAGPTIGPYAVDDPIPPPGTLEPADSSLKPAVCPAGPEAEIAQRALRDLPSAWTDESEGVAEVVAVLGSGPQAAEKIAESEIQLRSLTAGEAFGLLAWLGASGGAHGRRRGAARGRFEAWWCAAALVGLDGDDAPWPPANQELGDAIAELRWWRWDDQARPAGWFFGLAVDDPLDGIAWALAARDQST